jgi:hypothetical protein
MFGNQSNNKKETNVNTRSLSLMNSSASALQPSVLVLGFWNEMVSLKLHPELPKDKQGEGRKFDYDQQIFTSLTLEKAMVLSKAIQELIVPAVKENKEVFRGVPVGGNSLVGVGVVAKESEDGVVYTPFLGIYKDLDEEKKIPKSYLTYTFKTTLIVENFNHTTGSFDVTEDLTELYLFEGILLSSIEHLSHASTHSMRVVDRFYRDQLNNRIDEIGSKLGIAPRSNSYGGGQQRRDIFSGGGGSTKQTPVDEPAPISKLNNMSEIDEMFN